jgi:DNA replication and repair protein RecF
MAEAGAAIAANRARRWPARRRAGGAETAFPAAALDAGAGAPVPASRAADLATALRGRPRDMAAGRTLIGPHRADLGAVYTDKDVPARQCSTGEQKALLISLSSPMPARWPRTGAAPLSARRGCRPSRRRPPRRAFDEICALGAQAWMTGTGPELFAELGDRAQHIAVPRPDGIGARPRSTPPPGHDPHR